MSSQTRTLSVPGAELTYDVHGDLAAASAEAPALFLVATPMDAAGFTSLVARFDDRPVITYDPRNVGRSKHTGDTPTPETHAADIDAIVAALLPELGHDEVDVFGSSGGSINALALALTRPPWLRTLVAHEPPIACVLPDAEPMMAACADVQAAYQRAGMGLGMAKFLVLVSAQGPIDASWSEQPDPDPAMFGLPTEDDGSRDDAMMANMSTIPVWQPDLDGLREVAAGAAGSRLLLAYGEESGETMAARAPRALAAAIGAEPVVFPSDHGGFVGGEYGQMGKPDEFAARLREVLAG